jgi:exo-beta-1,3-glucanase (GH17 family)
MSSGHEPENKEKSKVWTGEEIELFRILLKKYGTDFHILSNFFPKKTKNQLKVAIWLTQNRYKQHASVEKKREKEEEQKLKAVSQLFQEVEEKEEREEEGER